MVGSPRTNFNIKYIDANVKIAVLVESSREIIFLEILL